MINTILTLLCIALLALWFIYMIFRIFGGRRKKRTLFMRDPSKAKYALIYVISYLIYFNGRLYSGSGILETIYASFENMAGTVLLTFKTEPIKELLQDSPMFGFAAYSCFSLIVLNVLLLSLSVMGQYVWRFLRSVRFRLFSRKVRLFIFGDNENSRFIYESAKDYEAVIVDTLGKESAEALFVSKIYYRSADKTSAAERLAYKIGRIRKKCVIVINTENDEENLKLCGIISKRIGELDEKRLSALSGKLRVLVFGNTEHESIFLQHEFSGKGFISYVNKYISISHNFINEMPLTLFMTEKQIDYSRGLIREGVNVNVFLIGFGRNNQQNFLTMTVNNQFLTESKGKVVPKKVSYYLFDKDQTFNNHRINHTYHRLEQEFRDGEERLGYLPIPDAPSDEHPIPLGTDSPDFYVRLKKLLTANPDDCNFMIISVGSDLENIEIAEKITERRKEWGVSNFTMFVKVSNLSKSYLGFESKDFYTIGNEKNTVYNIDRLLVNDLINIAARLGDSYADMSIKMNEPEVGRYPAESVSEYERMKYFSNISCALCIRTKLNLIGLDYMPKDAAGDKALTKEDYLGKYYAKFEYNNEKYHDNTAKPFGFKYNSKYPDTPRTNLALQEHLRWNAFMIRFGFVPASIEQIMNDENNGKNYSLHRHYKLTTHEGLIELRKMFVKKGLDAESADMIQKDFVVMDNLYDVLDSCNFAIVEKSVRTPGQI